MWQPALANVERITLVIKYDIPFDSEGLRPTGSVARPWPEPAVTPSLLP